MYIAYRFTKYIKPGIKETSFYFLFNFFFVIVTMLYNNNNNKREKNEMSVFRMNERNFHFE